MTDSTQDRVREAREQAYREALLEAAETVFADRGFAGAKMADIAAQAGVSLGTLYKVFDGKNELHRAVHGWRGQQILAETTREIPPTTSPLEAMLHGARAYVRFQVAHPDFLRLTLTEVHSWANAESMEMREQLVPWSAGFELAVQVFEVGIANGVFVRERPELHARMMISIFQVVLADWVATEMADSSDAVVQRVSDAIVRAFATTAHRQQWFASQQERR